MIEIPVYNTSGEQVGQVQVDPAKLGGEVRPLLLKQAYVRYHANQRQGTSATKGRSQIAYSTKKLYRQKGTGNARRGDRTSPTLRGGAHAFAKRTSDWRQRMPHKMRRLANRNALLAKAVDGEIKLVDTFGLDQPSTKNFENLLTVLGVDRSCLVALADVAGPEARSARNIDRVSLTQVDRLNAFDLLNHRYLLADRAAFEAYLERATADVPQVQEVAS